MTATQVLRVRNLARIWSVMTRQRGGGGGADWRRRRTAAPVRDAGVAAGHRGGRRRVDGRLHQLLDRRLHDNASLHNYWKSIHHINK